ncbi:MAG: hypothetical protein LBV51_01655 [Acholeplasmatales bacterium]|jgi:M6 family metalloprotease-like protein|nr:hypothetical protein [Acholeplasmatales bacterium]
MIKKLLLLINILFFSLVAVSCGTDQILHKEEFDKIQSAYASISSSLNLSNLEDGDDFVIPSDVEGVSVSCVSSDTAVITISGGSAVVHQASSSKVVILTYTLSYKDLSFSYKFTANVLGLSEEAPATSFLVTFNCVYSIEVISVNASSIIPAASIPTPDRIGYEFVGWTENDVIVDLSTTLINKTYILVAKYNQIAGSDTNIKISEAWVVVENALNASMPNPNAVNANINLLSDPGIEGVSVLWNSSVPEVLAGDGVLTPTFATTSISLVAIVKYNATYDSRTYEITVSKANYVTTEYAPYQYYNGGGEGIYANPIRTLPDQMQAFGNSQLRVGIPPAAGNSASVPTSALDARESITVNPIVIPIEFTDYKFSDNNGTAPGKNFTRMETLRIGFGEAGTNPADTGWESVASYYNKTSYGTVNYNPTILEPFAVNMTSTLFASTYGDRLDYQAINLSMEYVNNNTTITQHDANGDGYVDGIYLVYARPHSNEWAGQWWAHKSLYLEGYDSYPDVIYNEGDEVEIRPSVFMWASFDFFYEGAYSKIPIQCETFIHESGHMFGLPDFYDYDDEVGAGGGLGGFDMMDYNYGDHGPWNKILLGWTVPQVITETVTVKLYNAPASGQSLIIPYHWNHSFFTEYLVVDYYTKTGLFSYTSSAPAASGVRVYHVDATLGTPFMFNNSYTDHKLIDWISAKNRNTTSKNFTAGDPELFKLEGNLYNWNQYKWYTVGKYNPKVSIVVQEIAENYAIVSVQYEQR